MKFRKRREIFREMVAESRCIVPASVYDPLSARIAADAGYEAMMMAGSTASLAVLGAPDLVLLTLSEFAEQARRISRSSSLPLLVDADHGYGNALNVMRTVEELEDAGVSALTIEDTALPAQFNAASKTMLISQEEGIGKVRAALEARYDPALMVIARTSAASLSGIEDAVARCRVYEAAGADAVFLTGVRTRNHVEAICRAVGIPVMLGLLTSEIEDRDYLAAAGVRLALQGHLPLMAAIAAVAETMAALRTDMSAIDATTGFASKDALANITRQQTYDHWIREFMSEQG